MNKRYVLSALLAFAMAISGCNGMSDTAVRTYPTLADAHRDALFTKGWLPDIFPPSTFAIETRNNLDMNYSVGEFSLAPQEMPLLTAHLKRGAITLRFVDSSGTVEDHIDDGDAVWSYQGSGATWVFFCREELAHCEYVMETQR